jgi:6-phosphogluconolactonase
MALGVLSAIAPVRTQSMSPMLVYFGTYTSNTKSRGIYASSLDMSTGALSAPELVAETPNPSFLAIHPGRRYLYAVNEVNEVNGTKAGGVSAFSRDPRSGALTPLNRQPSGGPGPAHISADRDGAHALVANYGGGSVAVLPIGPDGRLQAPSSVVQHAGNSVNPQRQKEPHAHCIVVDSGNRFAYAADLGLDRILIYRFDAEKGTLTANDPPFAQVEPGSGPRHFAFHPKGRFAYVINEMTCTITAFEHDAGRGALAALQTISTLPHGQEVAKGFSTAEIQVHPSGLFLYGSNRGHDTIAVFSIDAKTGRLTHVQHESTQGSTPRNFGIDPTGRYLLAANQRSDSVVVFRIDQKTGRLAAAGHRLEVPSPVCVKFVGG